MQLGKPKRSFWEYVVVALLVSASLFLSVGIYSKRDFLFKSKIARLELLTLRNYVTAYILEHKKYPSDFQEVLGLQSSVIGLNDPFGSPYQYDPKTGWVISKNLP